MPKCPRYKTGSMASGMYADEEASCVMCGMVVYREYPDLPPIRKDRDENDNDLDSGVGVTALAVNGV